MKIKRLLIANRGEIAVRIICACREAGVSPVAVFSEADRGALHPALADAAVCIGAAPAGESYLRGDRIIEATQKTGADAIHPGYGFLSENAEFAAQCREASLCFVGPPADVIRRLGDKSEAKRLAQQAGVPTVPGYIGDDQSDERLTREAEQIGAPLLIKARAGGGGRGMRRVDDLTDLPSQLAEARREALAAFGSDHVLLERYLTHPRHIEVQIFGDAHGNVVALFERECSIQRRHQKILEESPSPVLTVELRREMSEAAIAAGKAAGYVNAGTVEFLLEETKEGPRFYFLEVNTRLQVEHPVTELRTGLDLVRLQFAVAEGMPLPFADGSVPDAGHAIEARICAEDASRNFLPSTGRLLQWLEPTGPGIRVDSGVVAGSDITSYYDPLLAKLIVHGADRTQSIERLEQALCNFHVLGVQTNIPYLLDIVRHPEFRAGNTFTGFLQTHFKEWQPPADIPNPVLLALAAESLTRRESRGLSTAAKQPRTEETLWQQTGGWRNG